MEIEFNVKFKCFNEDKMKMMKKIFFGKEAIFQVINLESGGMVERGMKDFTSLRKILEKIYPSQVVPPLPESYSDESEKLINYWIQLMKEHSIFREDEYFKSFLESDRYEEILPMIKNIEPPVFVPVEYLQKRFNSLFVDESNGIPNDFQYQKVKDSCQDFSLIFRLKMV